MVDNVAPKQTQGKRPSMEDVMLELSHNSTDKMEAFSCAGAKRKRKVTLVNNFRINPLSDKPTLGLTRVLTDWTGRFPGVERGEAPSKC